MSLCCQKPASGENRRGFLGQAAAVFCGGVALLVPAAAGLVAFLNPLRQKARAGSSCGWLRWTCCPTTARRRRCR